MQGGPFSIVRMRTPSSPPIPPIEMPPARTIIAPGRGELFLRDTGGDGPVVMLLHGWVASASTGAAPMTRWRPPGIGCWR
jgi:hypothetical protein